MSSQFPSIREQNKKIHSLVCRLVRHSALTDKTTTGTVQVSAQCWTNWIDMHGANNAIKFTLSGVKLSFQQEVLNPNILKTVTLGFSRLYLTRLHLTNFAFLRRHNPISINIGKTFSFYFCYYACHTDAIIQLHLQTL
jgi:hypothetical protein